MVGYSIPLVNVLRNKGIIYIIKGFFRVLKNTAIIEINHRLFSRNFFVNGCKIPYQHSTLLNGSIGNVQLSSERVVEIAYVKNLYTMRKPNLILEVGNVTRNWFSIQNLVVVDKYEQDSQGSIINEDIEDFESLITFDMIISISTVEHIGYDEEIKDSQKPQRVIEKMIKLLNENGLLIITVPLNYNPAVDNLIKNKIIKFTEMVFLKRLNISNDWKQVGLDEAFNSIYDSPYQYANSIAILLYRKFPVY